MERVFQIDKTDLEKYIVEPTETTKDHFNSLVITFLNGLSLDFHKKCHTFFFSMHENIAITRLNLCDVYVWCKHSSVSERVNRMKNSYSLQSVVMQTMFLNTVLVARPLCSEGDIRRGCKLSITSDGNTVQLVAKRGKSVKGKLIVGVSIFTPNVCTECKRGPKEVKLRACKRCFEHDRIRVLYCSKGCQKDDYDRHKSTCKADWSSDDWRDWTTGSRSSEYGKCVEEPDDYSE
jgi:hypothetical protein